MSHDCSKILSRVFLALDGELDPQEEKDFLAQIHECPSCLQKFDIEKSFKQFLCDKVNKKHVSENTISSIRNKIDDFRIQGNKGI